MKIKKEDIGLYFALGLVGAGVGLLVGAYIASKRGGSIPSYIPEGTVYDKEKGRFVIDEEWGEAVVEKRLEKMAEKTDRKIPRKKKRVKKGQKKSDPELEAFIKEFEPSAIQIELVKNGLTTLEELEETILQEKLAEEKEPYNYNGPYLEDDKPDLSDLAKLPEDEETVDDRYVILRQPPKRKSPKNMRVIYFDSGDGSFYTMTRKKQPVPIGSITEFISEETWEVMLPYMLSGFAPLFVNDLTNAKYYRFEIVPEDLEESSEDDEHN